MTAEELFWDLVERLYADPAVRRSTMMGLPCARIDGRFFAALDRRNGALLVKLRAGRVRQVIGAGHGRPFAPAGRTFREWVAVPVPGRESWQALLAEARDHAAAPGRHHPACPVRRTASGARQVPGPAGSVEVLLSSAVASPVRRSSTRSAAASRRPGDPATGRRSGGAPGRLLRHGRSRKALARRQFLGTTAGKVSRYARCMVMIVP